MLHFVSAAPSAPQPVSLPRSRPARRGSPQEFHRRKRAGLIDFQQPEIVTLLRPEALAHIAAGGTVPDTF